MVNSIILIERRITAQASAIPLHSELNGQREKTAKKKKEGTVAHRYKYVDRRTWVEYRASLRVLNVTPNAYKLPKIPRHIAFENESKVHST